VVSAPTPDFPHLVTVSGQDAPGIAQRLFASLRARGTQVEDVEQVRVHGRLLLCVEVGLEADQAQGLRDALAAALDGCGVQVTVGPLLESEGAEPDDGVDGGGPPEQQIVTVLAPEVDAAALEGLTGCVAASGGNIERIVRLAAYPVQSYELTVAGADLPFLRRGLAEEAARRRVDIAVQAAGLHRRAKHLIVLGADSTLLQVEVIDLLAARCGCEPEVAAVTEAAMAGELDFEDALRRRVRLLAGLEARDLDAVRDDMTLAPGARTLVRTLKRLGYELAVVSGGFVQVMEGLVAGLGIDHLAANTLVLDDGVLTGELAGPIVDRAGKAVALARFAEEAEVPLARTIAVGDGANDIDMLAAAGLGIAFNAKPAVREAADTALSVPYLDAILFLLGISRREVELADRMDHAEPAAAR
jgi:phosphoserine phosphatase